MELILTSFGLSHLRDQDEGSSNIFYRMPPVAMSQVNRLFLPDYPALLLCDRIIVDVKTYSRLVDSDESHWSYGEVANLLKALNDEGFLRLEDFEAVITENRSLLEEMLKTDLKEPTAWVPALTESATSWREFVDGMDQEWREDLSFQSRALSTRKLYAAHSYRHVLSTYSQHSEIIADRVEMFQDKRRKEYKEFLRRELAGYLSYVNANLVLSQTYETGFHDWYDFRPFYRAKFRSIGREKPPAQPEVDNVKKLFELSFPNLTFWEPHLVLKALKDKRIQDLRQLVAAAVAGEVEFDTEFATRILYEVFRVERNLSRIRNIVSYASIPFGLVPWVGTPLQKGVEETVLAPVARKKRAPFRWFYMISELAEKTHRQSVARE